MWGGTAAGIRVWRATQKSLNSSFVITSCLSSWDAGRIYKHCCTIGCWEQRWSFGNCHNAAGQMRRTFHFVLWEARRHPNQQLLSLLCVHRGFKMLGGCSGDSKQRPRSERQWKQIVSNHIKGQVIEETRWEAHYQVLPRQIQGTFPAPLFVSSDPEDHQQREICADHQHFYLVDHVIVL